MPNIVEYTNPNNTLTPTDRGIEAAVGTARRVGARYNEQAAGLGQLAGSMDRVAASTRELASDTTRSGVTFARELGQGINDAGRVAVAYEDHRQISEGAATLAQMTDALTQQWNDAIKKADPNDPLVAQRFRADVLEPALQNFKDSFGTENSQKWAETRADTLRSHMFGRTDADMGLLAGEAVKVNVRQMVNSYSNAVNSDPTSVDHVLDTVDKSVGDMVDSSPNLKGAAAVRARMEVTQQAKETIVKSAAIGAIAKSADPEGTAASFSQRFPDYINGDEVKMLAANARAQIRADRIDQTYRDTLQKKDIQQKSDQTEVEYLKKIYSDDPQVQAGVSTKAIVNDPTLTRESKERMINVVNREMKPETDAKISARTSAQLMAKIADPNADPDDVMKSLYGARTKDPGSPGSLTKADFADLQKQLIDRKTPQGLALAQDRDEFFKRYAPTIDPTMGDPQSQQYGHHTALGLQKMYEAQKAARRAEADAKAKGQDPHSIYDPSSPNFFGKPENLMRYTASLQDAAAFQASLGKGAPPAPPANTNLTGPGKTVTGVEVIDVPPDMSPADAMKKYKSGTRIRLPDGRMGTVP